MTEYRRYQGRSYMIFDTDAAAEGFEYPMLAENNITGLLPLKIINSDARMQFWYDISGKQPLEDWLKMKKNGSNFLKKFFHALEETLEQVCGYLLYEEGISLAPEKIFTDASGEEFAFCYLPFEKENFADALCGFMEYYLSHMQHEDRAEAQKCYEVYEKCRQKDTKLDTLLQILFEETMTDGVCFEDKAEEMPAEKKLPKREEVRSGPAKQPQKKNGFRNLVGDDAWKRKLLAVRKKKAFREDYAFEPKEYEETPKNPTVFLGSEKTEILGELKYEGDGRESNFKIEQPVFLIGNGTGEADGMIYDDTVSRIHARITKEGEEYYLEDLNSTNGTYRNGEILNYKEKVKLEKNDRISFAKENYRFV